MISDRRHGFSAGPVPVSAYVGSSKNLKDLKKDCLSWGFALPRGVALERLSGKITHEGHMPLGEAVAGAILAPWKSRSFRGWTSL